MHTIARRSAALLAAGAGAAAACYAGYVAFAWARYGHVAADAVDADPLLDRFMPVYDVVERHHSRVAAPAAVTFEAACEQDWNDSAIVRGIFRARQIVLGGAGSDPRTPHGMLELTRSIGWRVLDEIPGRAIVMGAVTQPWKGDVVFRGIPPEQFASFSEPDYVKIVWTLRADPIGDRTSLFRTETRAVATDLAARAKFRWYWARFSPGITLIRRLSLAPLRRSAEQRAQTVGR